MNILVYLIILAVCVALVPMVKETFRDGIGNMCRGLDQRDCYSAPHCGWCISDEGVGSCKKGDSVGPYRRDGKCTQWSTGWWSRPWRLPFPTINYNWAVPVFSWNPWRRRIIHDRNFRKKLRRIRKGGW